MIQIFPQPSKKNTAFTLVELAIVLVIIGLIVGGVLVGQEMIRGARVSRAIKAITLYQGATNSFRAKYNGLPGDIYLSQATQFGLPCAATRAGLTYGQPNGNGLIEGRFGTDTRLLATEQLWYWEDLAWAGLISDPIDITTQCANTSAYLPTLITTDAPMFSFLPSIQLSNLAFVAVGVDSWDGYASKNFYFINGFGNQSGGPITQSPRVTPNEAFMIDAKLDDGNPATGKVHGTDTTYKPMWSATVPGATDCLSTATTYNTTTTYGDQALCGVIIETGF